MDQIPEEGLQVTISGACRHDGPELAALARERLPTMTYLHDVPSWHERYRYGAGLYPLDNYLMTARVGREEELAAFLWADAALWLDEGIAEPWWCLNALAVDNRFAGRGFGRALVAHLMTAARQVGVVSIYGVTYPESATFWAKQGFAVGRPGQEVQPGSTGDLRVLSVPG